MIKTVHNDVWVFDVEWAPDPQAGRLLYHISDDVSDKDVVFEMFRQNGATEDNPTPFLKPVLCKICSIVALIRRVNNDATSFRLLSLPRDVADSEYTILETFLGGVGRSKPQLVGYNSVNADARILLQRAIVKGVAAASQFLTRPEKPWLGPDYFAKENDYHVDLYNLIQGWGSAGPSLHQMTTLSGIPGKLDCDGQQVYSLALEGRIKDIVAYNECDVLSTYLLWLRCIYVSGHLTREQYKLEQQELKQLIIGEYQNGRGDHLMVFLEAWESLQNKLGLD
jgi:hypothetical protein